MEDELKKIMQPKTIKIKNNGCGTAPGNLVSINYQAGIWARTALVIYISLPENG